MKENERERKMENMKRNNFSFKFFFSLHRKRSVKTILSETVTFILFDGFFDQNEKKKRECRDRETIYNFFFVMRKKTLDIELNVTRNRKNYRMSTR